MSEARDRLAAIVSADLLDLIEAVVDERVEQRVAVEVAKRTDPRKPWLTVEEAAKRLGCSPAAVRQRVRRDRLTAKRVGRRVYVSRESVDRLED